ncbi:helix-turn-helix domain-containing protein [Phyllobacterium sp. TAF24]|uniref:helix-turn-helix domain-containing protein n=1 Tax=Phyllobacterium sp. TAF24 TaxID=3233068 RepID=UPI003F974CF3
MASKENVFGEGILEGLEEALAWKRGKIGLETVNIDSMPAERIKKIRKLYSKSTKDFERRFGIPAATMNNWEQGRRKPDPAGRVLLKIIEESPEVAEKAARAA